MPRIARNYGATDKTATSVLYPAQDFLVFRPKNIADGFATDHVITIRIASTRSEACGF